MNEIETIEGLLSNINDKLESYIETIEGLDIEIFNQKFHMKQVKYNQTKKVSYTSKLFLKNLLAYSSAYGITISLLAILVLVMAFIIAGPAFVAIIPYAVIIDLLLTLSTALTSEIRDYNFNKQLETDPRIIEECIKCIDECTLKKENILNKQEQLKDLQAELLKMQLDIEHFNQSDRLAEINNDYLNIDNKKEKGLILVNKG